MRLTNGLRTSELSWFPALFGDRILPLNPLLYIDATDMRTLFQDLAGTTPITTNGQTILSIRDKSSNGYLVPADSATSGGTYSTVGAGRIHGDGSTTLFQLGNRLGLGADPGMTVVAAMNTGVAANSIERVWHLGGSLDGHISGAVGTDGVSWRHGDGNRVFDTIADNTDTVVTWRRSAGDTYGEQETFVDGVSQTQTSVSGGTNSPTNTADFFSLFALSNGNTPFPGDICALAVFGELSDTDMQIAVTEFQRKCAVSAEAGDFLFPDFNSDDFHTGE